MEVGLSSKFTNVERGASHHAGDFCVIELEVSKRGGGCSAIRLASSAGLKMSNRYIATEIRVPKLAKCRISNLSMYK